MFIFVLQAVLVCYVAYIAGVMVMVVSPVAVSLVTSLASSLASQSSSTPMEHTLFPDNGIPISSCPASEHVLSTRSIFRQQQEECPSSSAEDSVPIDTFPPPLDSGHNEQHSVDFSDLSLTTGQRIMSVIENVFGIWMLSSQPQTKEHFSWSCDIGPCSKNTMDSLTCMNVTSNEHSCGTNCCCRQSVSTLPKLPQSLTSLGFQTAVAVS